jgi:hypothetical protein
MFPQPAEKVGTGLPGRKPCYNRVASHMPAGAQSVSIDDDITAWISTLNSGDAQAPQVTLDRYIEALIRKVRRTLEGIPRRGADEVVVAIGPMQRFFCVARCATSPRPRRFG